MNHSEYLRRKMESMPRILAPARPGDASETTRIRGAIASAAGRQRATPQSAICCGPRVRTVRLPSGVISYVSTSTGSRLGAGCGFSDDRTASRTTQVAAGCALIGAASTLWTASEPPVTRIAGCIPTGEIRQACCPQESTPEVPRDATGRPTDPTRKALAYQGHSTCCPYQGLPLQAFAPEWLANCCYTPGNIDTVTMNDVPASALPITPARQKSCCPGIPPASDC
jgi:hypothetical protein